MADLDYGYEVTIAQNATSDPAAATITNQWQRRMPGNTIWENILGESGVTYTIATADRSAKIRLQQDLDGTKAFSNELLVTSALGQPSPCDSIGTSLSKIHSGGQIQASVSDGTTLVIAGKSWLKYLQGLDSSFKSGSTPPNLDGSNSSGKDQIYKLGATTSTWIIVTKIGEGWTSSYGYGGWVRRSQNIFKGFSGGTYFSPKAAASDGTVMLAAGVNYTGTGGSGLVYSVNGSTWTTLPTAFPSNLSTGSNAYVSAANGYYAARGGSALAINTDVGDFTKWRNVSVSSMPGNGGIGAFGHLGFLYQVANKYKIYNPWTGATTHDFVWPWLEESGNGYNIENCTPKSVLYSDAGIYFISGTLGVVMSSCNGTSWKLHENSAYATDLWYQALAAWPLKVGRVHIVEGYSFYGNGSVSYLQQ